MAADVYVEVETTRPFGAAEEALVVNAVKAALAYEGFAVDCEVNVLITDDADIRALNKLHRDIDTATDVLSFPFYTREDLMNITAQGPVILGDIVISMETASAQADAYGHGAERELSFLAVHGALHLLGRDHETPEDETDMEVKQEEILGIIGIQRRLS